MKFGSGASAFCGLGLAGSWSYALGGEVLALSFKGLGFRV